MRASSQRQKAAGLPPSPPATECERRLRRLRRGLADRDLDGLVVYGSGPTNPDAVRYLAGYVHPFPRARSVLVVPVVEDPVLLIDRDWHLAAAREMTWVADVRRMPTPAHGTRTGVADSLAAALTDCGLDSGAVGVLGVDVPAAVTDAIAASGVDPDLAAGQAVWDGLVAAPTEHDVRHVEETAAIADAGLAALATACEPGRSERAVCFDVLAELASEGAEFQHANAISTHVDVGAYAHSESNLQPFLYTETDLDAEEMFWVDVIVCHDGYYVDCDRTVSVGEPTPEQRRLYEACEEMYDAMVATVEPGVAGRTVWQAAHDVAAEYGYEDHLNGVYLGHTTGITISTGPVVGPEETRTLAAGHLLNVEPAVHVPGVGAACIENTLHVESDGTRVLNGTPTDLVVV